MNNRHTMIACVLLCLLGGFASAQDNYPSTRYQDYANRHLQDEWATSPPTVPDLSQGTTEYQSMSPDSWNRPPAPPQARTNSVPSNSEGDQTVPVRDGNSPSGKVEKQLDPPTGSPFQSSSFQLSPTLTEEHDDIDAPKSLLPSTRYPLLNETASTTPAPTPTDEVPMEPAADWHVYETDAGAIHDPYSLEPAVPTAPNYRPDLGHRAETQVVRSAGLDDVGQIYEFENTGHPSFREVLATGRYFGSAELLSYKPAFQANSAVRLEGPGVGRSVPFHFDYAASPHFRFGFESCLGPGVEFDFWQYDKTSSLASFSSDGQVTATTSSWMQGANRMSRLSADQSGQRLDATHSMDVRSFGVSFFKEMKFRVSRLNGRFGFRYASVSQQLDATVTSGAAIAGSLVNQTDLDAWGPLFSVEYFRPIGHTRLELLATFGGSAMFGNRNQFVSNTAAGEFDQFQADEFVTTVDFLTGIQYRKMTAENRSIYARVGLNYQSWIAGGTAIDPQDDFGLRGFSFGVGYNR